MDHRTDPTDLDEALARILAEPTWARQIIEAVCVALRTEDPFLTLTLADLDALLTSTSELLLSHLPAVVIEEAEDRAANTLPLIGPRETHDAYATRLHRAARNL